MQLVEIARQSGDNWVDRRLVTPDQAESYFCEHHNEPLYRSTYAIEVSVDPESIKPEEVSVLFESSVKKGDLVFDFDGPDLEKVREDLFAVLTFLESSLGVTESSVKVYFSGRKGYHLVIPFGCTGLEPRVDLHELYRKLAHSLQGYARNKTLDLRIYNARRLFRVPLSVHQVTGKRKIRLDIKKLRESGVHEDIEDKDTKPVESSRLNKALLRIETKTDETLRDLNRLPKEFYFKPLDCIQHVLEKGVPEGLRNDAAYTTALYLKGTGRNRAEVKDILLESALVTVSGMDRQELSKTVTSAFDSRHRFGLWDNVLSDYVSELDKTRWVSARLDESYMDLAEVARDFYQDLLVRKENMAKYFVDPLDKRLGGINGGELVVLGGATGTGKSEFAFSVALKNALNGTPSAFITLEVSNRDFVARLLRGKLNINPALFWSGELSQEELLHVKHEIETLQDKNAPLFFRRKKSLMTVQELDALVSSLILEQQCRLIVIDHLHYMGGKDRSQKENDHISASIRAINNLAVKYNVAIVCVAHFRKQPDPLHRPTLHEFRDSSSIEQEASTILILWRNLTGQGQEQFRTEINVAKSRKDVTLGVSRVMFNPKTRNYDPI